MSEPREAFAVLGLFDGAQELVDAIPKLRERGLGRLEAYTPYPVHGLDQALGLRKSPVGGMVFVMGILGAVAALAFEWWTSAVDYPVVTGGKPLFSWQAFVPIMFEVMVLFATFTAGLGMLFLLNRLPFFSHPVLASKSIRAITRDRFALSVEADGRPLDAEAAGAALRAAGAREVEVLPVPRPALLSARSVGAALGSVAVACLVAGVLTYAAVKLFPRLPPMVHMQEQPRLDAFAPSSFFADGHGMRTPVKGTVARGHLPYPFATVEEARGLANPLARTPEVLARGRRAYETYCAVCHGVLGDGLKSLTSAYGAAPANLQSQAIRDYPDGQIYHSIVKGKNAMPSYAADLGEDERWAVVHYVRVLERALNAREEDVR